MRKLVILGVDRVDRHAGARGRRATATSSRSLGSRRRTRWERLLAQAVEHGVDAGRARRTRGGRRARSEAWTGGEVLAGPEGLDAPDRRVRRRPRAERPRRLGRARPDGRGARRGHRPRARQQGEPGRRRRARDAARRGDRRARDPGRLRALRPLPAAPGRGTRRRRRHRRAAGADRLRRAVPRHDAARRCRTSDVEAALAHPTWDMGGKITIDSATLMNKGLELIEAHHLFGFPYERIDVVVHPESIVHAVVQLNDGASLAHLGYPDMRVPISYALHYPGAGGRRRSRPLDLAAVGQAHLRGARPRDAFRCLALARDAADGGRHRALRPERRQRGRRARLPRRPARVPRHRRA